MSDTHKCRICGEEKILSMFPINKSYKSGRATQCKVCQNKRAYEYRCPITLAANKFGISKEEVTALRNKRFCEICGKENHKRALCIDHDHLTGKVRGALCDSCNKGIGLFLDNPELLVRASKYLQGK